MPLDMDAKNSRKRDGSMGGYGSKVGRADDALAEGSELHHHAGTGERCPPAFWPFAVRSAPSVLCTAAERPPSQGGETAVMRDISRSPVSPACRGSDVLTSDS